MGNPDAQLGAITLHCYIPPPRNARVWLASKGTREEDSFTVPTCLYSAFGKRLQEGADGAAPPAGGASIMAPVAVTAAAGPAKAVPGAGEVIGSPPKPEAFADKLVA